MKNKKDERKTSSSYMLWTYKSENKFQEFPKDGKLCYVTKPSNIIPKSGLESKNITYPKPLPLDLMLNEGILRSAMTHNTSKYFDAHNGEKFITIVVMFRGRYKAQILDKNYDIPTANYFILPANTPVIYFAQENQFEYIWFHIKNTPYWRHILGSSPRVGKMNNFDNFISLYKMYLNEIYSANRSISYLQSLLNALLETMKKEFLTQDDKEETSLLETLAGKIYSNMGRDWKISTICKRQNLTPYKLNKLFISRYGISVSKYITKIRMGKAQEFLKMGYNLEKIRKELGYSNSFSFSTAFKQHYGMSPRKYKSILS